MIACLEEIYNKGFMASRSAALRAQMRAIAKGSTSAPVETPHAEIITERFLLLSLPITALHDKVGMYYFMNDLSRLKFIGN